MNPRLLLSGLPVAVFFGLSRVAEAWVAIAGGFAASTLVFAANRRDRLIGGLTAFGFMVVAISAVAGIVAGSEKAYLASGPISDFLFVPIYVGSVFIGRPLVGGIARELVPYVAQRLPADAPVFAWLSLAWAGYDLVHGAVRLFMLEQLSVGEYLVWSRLIGWPITAVMLAVTAFAIYRAIRASERRRMPRRAAGPGDPALRAQS